MQTKIITMLAALGLTSFVSAAPLEARQDSCSLFPWFIGPHASSDCSGDPAYFQPTSGPISSDPQNVYCAPLYDPNGAPQSFGSVAINRDACPQQQWQINLYTDADCATAPTVVTSDICAPAPGPDAAGQWLKFDAVLMQ